MVTINESIIIDRNSLEDECSSAPAYFDYYQNLESDLKSQKENREHGLSLEIRKMSENDLREKHGLSKLTEGSIAAIVKSDPAYHSLNRRWLSAMAERKSWEKKIDMLDTLAKLHGQGYFAKIEGKKETVSLIANHVKKKISEQIKKRSEAAGSDKMQKPQRPR